MAKKNTNTNKNKNNGNNKKRNNNRNHKNNNFKPRKEENKILNDGICEYEEGITVDELAQKINHTPAEVIKVLFMLGTMVTINTALIWL